MISFGALESGFEHISQTIPSSSFWAFWAFVIRDFRALGVFGKSSKNTSASPLLLKVTFFRGRPRFFVGVRMPLGVFILGLDSASPLFVAGFGFGFGFGFGADALDRFGTLPFLLLVGRSPLSHIVPLRAANLMAGRLNVEIPFTAGLVRVPFVPELSGCTASAVVHLAVQLAFGCASACTGLPYPKTPEIADAIAFRPFVAAEGAEAVSSTFCRFADAGVRVGSASSSITSSARLRISEASFSSIAGPNGGHTDQSVLLVWTR